jgi:hypothetical protein
VAARVVIGVVAVVVLAWLAVMERDARLQARGVKAAGQLRVPGNFARAESDLLDARLLNPDTTPDLARAVLYQAAQRPEQAAALVENVLRREPENLAAWSFLLAVERGRDSAAVARAVAARRRLDPVNALRNR